MQAFAEYGDETTGGVAYFVRLILYVSSFIGVLSAVSSAWRLSPEKCYPAVLVRWSKTKGEVQHKINLLAPELFF